VAVSPPGDVTGPQIVFGDQGNVYVIWSDFGSRELRMARSPFDPTTTRTVAPFRRINFSSAANSIAGGIRVLPLASAQYNHVSHEIVVAWSDGESDLSPLTDLHLVHGMDTFAPINLDALNGTGSDQFTPAVAIAANGNIVMAWYDRTASTGTEYRERMAELTPAGAIVGQTVVGPPCGAATVGEYQWLSRSRDSSGGLWQLAWACSGAETAIWETGVELGSHLQSAVPGPELQTADVTP